MYFKKRASLFLALSIFSTAIIIYMQIKFNSISNSGIISFNISSFSKFSLASISRHELTNEERSNNCKIPKIDPFDSIALKLIEDSVKKSKRKIPHCAQAKNKFTTDLSSNLIKLETNETFWTENICCYIPYTTIENNKKVLNLTDSCIAITKLITYIKEEYENVRVLCHKKSDPNQKMLNNEHFNFFRLNNTVENELDEKLQKLPKNDQMSIVFFGIDSVSLTNFQRFAPKTRKFILEELGGVEFIGLNKVGRGTMENLVPTLSGCTFIYDKTIFPSKTQECHLIWEKYYKEQAYRTVLSEEQFWKYAYQKMKRNEKGQHGMNYTNFPFVKGASGGPSGCIRQRLAPQILTDRVVQVAQKLKNKLYFHYMWSALLTHDYIDYAQYLDEPLLEMLTNLVERELLENTVLIFMSDHGTVTSEYSRTPNGLIEARLPFIYLIFPPKFKEKYRVAFENVVENSERLITHYDIYQTLQDLLNVQNLGKLELRDDESKMNGFNFTSEYVDGKRMSLFRPIPENRTCAEAGIPDEYCICYADAWSSEIEGRTQVNISRAVNYVLNEINKRVSKAKKCYKLDLEKILSGRERKNENNEKNESILEVQFQVIPSGGIFGATLKVDSSKSSDVELKFKLVGEIERLNLYGNQSLCLGKKDHETGWVRSACFCKNIKVFNGINLN